MTCSSTLLNYYCKTAAVRVHPTARGEKQTPHRLALKEEIVVLIKTKASCDLKEELAHKSVSV